MKIKKIKIYKSKVTITLEDRKTIDLDKNVFTNFYLYEGKNLSKKELLELHKQNDNAALLNYAYKLRQKSPYTEHHMREKLYDKGGLKSQVDEVIKSLKKSGLIDDRKFIEEHIEYYSSLNYGKNKIINKLLEKGIFKETLDRIIFPLANEKRKASRIFKKLNEKYSKYNDAQRKKHVYQAYIALGFEPDIAQEMVGAIQKSSPKEETDKLEAEFNKVYKRYQLKYNKKEFKSKLLSYLASKGYKINDILKLFERKHIA